MYGNVYASTNAQYMSLDKPQHIMYGNFDILSKHITTLIR